MRLPALALAVMFAVPLGAQEAGIHGALALPRGANAVVGPGVSLAGSFRVGSLLADTALARRASLRVGLRASFSVLRTTEPQAGGICLEPCVPFPPSPPTVRVRMQLFQGALFLVPWQSARTRLDVSAGAATYSYRGNANDDIWSFTGGVAISRRVSSRAPLWMNVTYDRNSRAMGVTPADGHDRQPPRHTVRLGVLYRVADR